MTGAVALPRGPLVHAVLHVRLERGEAEARVRGVLEAPVVAA
eukprot:CAMPEP_0185171482 /NCGR_PEP_ID=MMETSP1139-20130426/20258_1 /TAXON_ID=298111 /ORGANISM="Pavlova sp., Strain CCMP459" /LENGTH=41 /DNA_ID= /DNA_START= /DNA_END= /DNA_ORIENTATION=